MHPVVQGGKDGLLRLLTLDNLSGQAGPGHTGGGAGPPLAVPQGGVVLATPAVWTDPRGRSNWALAMNAGGIWWLKLLVASGGRPSFVQRGSRPAPA